MNNFFKKTSTWAVIAFIVIVSMGFWAYKSGVFSGGTKTNSSQQAGAVSYKGAAGKTALDLLKAEYPGKVEIQSFSSGEMVSSINGTKADSKHYWSFLVNGKEATVGAGRYVTKDGDTIEWQLKEINTKL